MPELMKYFKAAFLGRVTLVPYLPLSDSVLRQIIELQLRRIVRRVREILSRRIRIRSGH